MAVPTSEQGGIPDERPDMSVINLEGEPSSIVNHCVNALSGDYVDISTDLVIPGAQPIVIQRNFSSSNKSLWGGWHFNYESSLLATQFGSALKIDSHEGSGARLSYRSYIKDGVVLPFGLAKNVIDFGFTNCGSGAISGRTNHKNTQIELQKNNFGQLRCEMHLGSGAKRTYRTKSFKSDFHVLFGIYKDEHSNGNQFHYKSEEEDRIFEIRATNANSKEIAFVKRINPKQFGKKSQVVVQSCDDRKVFYQLDKIDDRYYLTESERPNAPLEKYEYAPSSREGQQLIRKDLPQGRFLEIDYYKKGENKIANHQPIKVHSNDPCLGRVKQLKAPVGPDSTPIVTHSFYYHIDQEEEDDDSFDDEIIRPKPSYTIVYDALQRKALRYDSDANMRLTRAVKYKNNSFYRQDLLFWGSNSDAGNLITRVVKGDGQNYCCRHIKYDRQGNIVKEQLWGNLTGFNTEPLKIDDEGIPKKNGCEVYAKRFVYSEDGFNLPILEDDKRKKISTAYVPNTDLVSRRIIYDENRRWLREFYEYDANAVLIKKVIDDGSADTVEDLSDVTERHITYITPRQTMPIGLPEIIEEKYLDLSSGQEKLLKKLVNHHSPQGQLQKQDHYGSDGVLAYTLSWDYDKNGNVVRETNAIGEKILREFDKNNNKISEQGPRQDFHKEFSYDYANRLIREEEIYASGLKLSTTHKYNILNQRIATIDIYGNETRFEYDDCGRLIATHYPEVPNEKGELISSSISTEYNALDQPITKKDAKGYVTRQKFTIRGKTCSIEYPDGSKESCEYFLDGLLKRTVEKNGLTTHYQYDSLGNNTVKEFYSSTGELLKTTSAEFNAFHKISEKDAKGYITTYEYDYAGRLIKTSKGKQISEQEYDALGRVSKIRTNDSLTIREYDLLDRVVSEKIEDTSGNHLKHEIHRFEVDKTYAITMQQAGEATHTTIFNARNQPELIIDALGHETRFHYLYTYCNAYGKYVPYEEKIDPLGNVTITICDARGKCAEIQRRNPLGNLTQKTEFFHDSNGNLIKTIETVLAENTPSRKVIKQLEYDSLNRLIGITEALGTAEQKYTQVRYNLYGQKEAMIYPSGISIVYEYDSLGLLKSCKASDQSIHYTYKYDLNGNPYQSIDEIDHTCTTCGYDENDGLIRETLGNGLTMQYDYDGLGRLLKIEYPDKSQALYNYQGPYIKSVRFLTEGKSYTHCYDSHDLSGRLTQATMIGKTGSVQYDYDLAGRLNKISSKIWSCILSYDSIGNLLQKQTSDPQNSCTDNYTYDALYQLTSEKGGFSHTYQHDSMNNRLCKNGKSHKINPCNQLLHDGTSEYSYDLNGNLKQKGPHKYTYDALNRLIEVEHHDHRVIYRYDAQHRRLKQETFRYIGTEWKKQTTKRFLFQGNNEVGSYDENGTLLERRVLGSSRGAENGAAIVIELSGKVYAPLHDHNGNVISIVDADSGQEEECYRYSAFGEEETSGTRNPWRFSSKRTDSETGLVYFGKRYYDPSAGRWLTCDPWGECDGPNLYAYLANNPQTQFDAYGLMSWNDVLKPSNEVKFMDNYEMCTNNFFEYCKMVHHCVNVAAYGDNIREECRYFPYDGYIPIERNYSQRFQMKGKSSPPPGLGIGFINGILTTLGEAQSHARKVSDLAGGVDVQGVYNATFTFLADVQEAGYNLYGHFATPPVRKLHEQWNDFFASSDKPFLQTCHSQGAIHVRNALLSYDLELRKRIIVVGIAPAAYISPKICKECYHYVSRDVVPWLDLIGRFSNSEYVYPLKPHPDADWNDHSFQSPTYAEIIEQRLKSYINNYSQ